MADTILLTVSWNSTYTQWCRLWPIIGTYSLMYILKNNGGLMVKILQEPILTLKKVKN